MKKITVLLMAFMLLIPSFAFANSNSEVKAEDGHYPTAKEIKEINKALDEMVVEANKKLENGVEEFKLKKAIGKGAIEFSFDSTNKTPIMSNQKSAFNNIQAAALAAPSGRKVYVAHVTNTEGWNFEHVVAGEFVYSGGKVTGSTMEVKQSGAMYGESHRSWIDILDPSVRVVHSNGTFKALKFLVEYNTYLTVRLLGSGDYRVERAQISF